MEYNDWILFWTAFGAIGGTIGALATAMAVIVALWQTKYANRKKLKIDFSDKVTVVPAIGGIENRQEFMSITATNIGNRNVKVCSWQLRLPNGRNAVVLQDTSPVGKLLSPSWPVTLEPEDSTSQYWRKDLFYAFIKDEVSRGQDKNKKIVWIVKDSTDKEYSVKSPKTLQEYCREAEDYYNANS